MDRGLIIGAGPVGLAAALFLAHAKRSGRLPDDFPLPRLIDAGDGDPPHSRALAVNPRTLELLSGVGVTDQMFDLGRKVFGGRLWHRGQVLFEPSFDGLPTEYPFLLALSQSESVRLLREAFEALGGSIERQTQCSTVTMHDGRVSAAIQRAGQLEDVQPAWLLAADGSRSVVRHALNLSFEGSSLERPWNLVDIALDTDLPADRANIVFLEDEGPGKPAGFLFVMRVVDREHPRDGNFWRVMGNVDDPVSRLPRGKAVAEPEWVSSFHIAHRIVGQLSVGNVYLAGDAVHLHSPMGARGMNLGIEDAWVFAESLIAGQLDQYHARRKPVDAAVVKNVNRATRMVIGESAITRRLRTLAPQAMRLSPLRHAATRMLTGLDHELPFPVSGK